MHCPYLVGQRTYLRPFDPAADSKVVVAWFNDPEVLRYMTRFRPVTLPDQEAFLRDVTRSDTAVSLAMVEREGDRLIGAVNLFQIDWRDRHAALGITIGEKDCWNKGHGTEAIRLILSHAFATMNLNRVWLMVYEHNDRARHVYEKVGFKTEGRLRQDAFRDGRYWDSFVMAVLRDEWPA